MNIRWLDVCVFYSFSTIVHDVYQVKWTLKIIFGVFYPHVTPVFVVSGEFDGGVAIKEFLFELRQLPHEAVIGVDEAPLALHELTKPRKTKLNRDILQ